MGYFIVTCDDSFVILFSLFLFCDMDR